MPPLAGSKLLSIASKQPLVATKQPPIVLKQQLNRHAPATNRLKPLLIVMRPLPLVSSSTSRRKWKSPFSITMATSQEVALTTPFSSPPSNQTSFWQFHRHIQRASSIVLRAPVRNAEADWVLVQQNRSSQQSLKATMGSIEQASWLASLSFLGYELRSSTHK